MYSLPLQQSRFEAKKVVFQPVNAGAYAFISVKLPTNGGLRTCAAQVRDVRLASSLFFSGSRENVNTKK
ncbi:MAG: hypothetical protein LBP83_03520 [Dysgonamonadaceae bacterium]|jgi:hypothetical protein|nr:hypothetical protein [Dysgonamonadaceae bacterium]